MLGDLYALYKVLTKAGALYPNPLLAITQFLWCYFCYGSSLSTLAAWSALRFPDTLAVVEENKQVTFRELENEVEKLAFGLTRSLELKPEQTIGLLGRNSVAYVETLLACEQVGANILLLHTTFAPEDLVRLQHLQAIDVLICDDEFQTTVETFLELLKDAKQSVPKVMYSSSLASLENTLLSKPKFSWRKKRGRIILLTSGTTGQAKVIRQRPKLVLKTFHALLESFRLSAGEKTLLTLPLLHGHGLATLALCLVVGAPLFVFRKGHTEDFLRYIEEYKINTLTIVPTILYRLLEHLKTRQYQTRSLSKIISGSAPLAAELTKSCLEKFGSILFNVYGSSEAGPISLATPKDLQDAPETVGKILPGVKLRFQEQHVQVMKNGAFFDTGDVGYVDDSNNLFLLGRSDDMLICGGENVYPRLVEERVNALEYVLESAVVGVPDLEYGQAVHLFVVLTSRHVTLAVIEKDLEQLFSRAMRPRKIFIVHTLPKTLTGKVVKSQLNESAS